MVYDVQASIPIFLVLYGQTKKISYQEGLRVSDEVIVSNDLEEQQNPPGSQGPLDWIAVHILS